MSESFLEVIDILLKSKEDKLAINLVKFLENRSSTTTQFDILAKAVFDGKRYSESLELCEKALSLAESVEEIISIRTNMVKIYTKLNHPEKALEQLTILQNIAPPTFDLLAANSFAHYLNNEKHKAEEILLQLLTLDLSEKDRTSVKFNLGTYKMMRGEFLSGLHDFLIEGKNMGLWHNAGSIFSNKIMSTIEKIQNDNGLIPWDGSIQESIQNKKFVVLAEAGIGDEIINIRFLNKLKSMGFDPYWYQIPGDNRTSLSDMFRRNGFNVIESLVGFEGSIYSQSMHLPLLMKLDPSELWDGPYLFSEPRKDINSNKLKIAIRWQGNTEYEEDLHRSVDLNLLLNTLDSPVVEIHSIQRDINYKIPSQVIDHRNEMRTWDDTLSIIQACDVVVTTCTSVAHASAAMGKKTYVFVPISSYYVWCHPTEKSPWYGDHVTLLRQVSPRSWTEPLRKLKNELQI